MDYFSGVGSLDGLIVIGRNRVIRFFNPAAEKLFGHSSFDAIGKNFEHLVPSAHNGELHNYFSNPPTFENSHSRGKNFEVEGVGKNGNKILLGLAVSANAMEKDIKSCLSAGFTDYIVKPINIPKFLEKIEKLLT